MMSKKELLKTQQSVLHRLLSEGRAAICHANTAIEHWTDLKAFYKRERKELHEEQYALSKLLKSVEQEIRWEADKLRLMKEASAIAQEQGEYE